MNARWSAFAVAGIAAGIAGFLGVGCVYCTIDMEDRPSEPIDLDVDVDLHAVVPLSDSVGDNYYMQLAVGEAGTIVAWGEAYSGGNSTWFTEVSQAGSADLRAAWIAVPEQFHSSVSWWVVGDAGTIASSDNHGTTWNTLTLPGIDADLHGITGFAGRPVIVGDEIVVVRLADGTWVEPPPPADGWGSLRGAATVGDRIYAVGLAGAAWSSTDPSGEWQPESVGSEADLFAIDSAWFGASEFEYLSGAIVVGAAGTLAVFDSVGWRRIDTGLDVDLIDTHGGCLLAADGEVYTLDAEEDRVLLESMPGAEAVNCEWAGTTSVGVGGFAMTPPLLDEDC